MNLGRMSSPLVIYGALAAGLSAALHLAFSTRIELRRQQKRHIAECLSLRDAITALEERGLHLRTAGEPSPPLPVAYPAARTVHSHQRSEALRMFALGADCQTISDFLGFRRSEIPLLEAVQRLQNSKAS